MMDQRYRVTTTDGGRFVGMLTINNERGIQLDGHIWFDRDEVESVSRVSDRGETIFPIMNNEFDRQRGAVDKRAVERESKDDGSVVIAYALLLVMPVIFLATLAGAALSAVS